MKQLYLLFIVHLILCVTTVAQSSDSDCTHEAKIDYQQYYKTIRYPEWIFKYDLSGYISVSAEMDTSGYLRDMFIHESYCDELNQIVMSCLQRIKHAPAKLGCRPVVSRLIINVKFYTKQFSSKSDLEMVMDNYKQLLPLKTGKALGRFYYQRGMQLFKMGEDSLAQEDYYRSLYELNYDDIPYFDAAIYDEIQHFLPKDTQNPDSLHRKAILLTQFFLYAKAAECYDSLISGKTDRRLSVLMMLQYRAGVYIQWKQYDKAIDDFLRVVSIDSNNVVAYTNLGWYHYLLNNFDSCMYYSQKAIAKDTAAYTAKFNSALVLLRLGKITEAQNLYKNYIVDAIKGNYRMKGAIDDVLDLIKNTIQVDASRDILINYFNVDEKALRNYLNR